MRQVGSALIVMLGLASVLSAQPSWAVTDAPKTRPIAKAKTETGPACRAPEYRQFDFWLGDWDVHAPNGSPAGHNLVTLEQDGCLLVEHWKASDGKETGTSFNYFDIRDRKWHQLYIDNSGNAGEYPAMAGNFVDGKMVLITDEKQSPVFRWTWYTVKPGTVRQMAEQSNDGEKTWKVVWDSFYRNGARSKHS